MRVVWTLSGRGWLGHGDDVAVGSVAREAVVVVVVALLVVLG